MLDIMVLGRLTSCDIIFAGLNKMPQPGEEEFCKDFAIKAGGSANTAIALAKLGVRTGLFTELGMDLLGGIVYKFIEEAGVSTEYIARTKDLRTCVSAVLSTKNERGFATYAEEGDYFTMEHIAGCVGKANYVCTDIVHCMTNPVAEAVKQAGGQLVVDACWNLDMKLDRIIDILRSCTLFTANETEAQIITGETDSRKALEILAKYAGVVIIKLGSMGCVAMKDGEYYQANALSHFKPVDTTGAGDLFNAGFLYGLVNGWDLESSLRLANVTGGLAVTFYGGIDDAFSHEIVMQTYAEIPES